MDWSPLAAPWAPEAEAVAAASSADGRGIPPCTQKMDLSMIHASGKRSKTWLQIDHTCSPNSCPNRFLHWARNEPFL
jgi:hypothetical protein